VRPSKKEQLLARRAEVWKLYSQGLTQDEISKNMEKYQISQQTVSKDIQWCKQDALDFIKDHRKQREQLALTHMKVIANFEELRKLAWKHYHSTQNEDIKTHLYSVIQSINRDIETLALGTDEISDEFLALARTDLQDIKHDFKNLIETTEEKQREQ
jgi:transposase